jgi:hypothetical protein
MKDFDFMIDLRSPKQQEEDAEWGREHGEKYKCFEPDWETIKRLASAEDYEPKTVLFMEKGEAPSLEDAQEFVGGYIEIVHTRKGAQLIIDEVGRHKDLPVNELASMLYGGPIKGPAMILVGEAKWT